MYCCGHLNWGEGDGKVFNGEYLNWGEGNGDGKVVIGEYLNWGEGDGKVVMWEYLFFILVFQIEGKEEDII